MILHLDSSALVKRYVRQTCPLIAQQSMARIPTRQSSACHASRAAPASPRSPSLRSGQAAGAAVADGVKATEHSIDRWLFIAFVVRDDLIRVISARDMNQRETRKYAERAQRDTRFQR